MPHLREQFFIYLMDIAFLGIAEHGCRECPSDQINRHRGKGEQREESISHYHYIHPKPRRGEQFQGSSGEWDLSPCSIPSNPKLVGDGRGHNVLPHGIAEYTPNSYLGAANSTSITSTYARPVARPKEYLLSYVGTVEPPGIRESPWPAFEALVTGTPVPGIHVPWFESNVDAATAIRRYIDDVMRVPPSPPGEDRSN